MQFDLWKLTNEPGVRSDKKAGKKCVAQLFLQRPGRSNCVPLLLRTHLGQAMAFLGPSPRRQRPHFVSSAVAAAGPQRSRRPPLYWGSSHQQLLCMDPRLCELASKWLRKKKTSAGRPDRCSHGYENRRLDVQTYAIVWLHSASKRTTHMLL